MGSTRRKSGALRYGFIAATAILAQTIPVEPLIVSLSLPEATISVAGTSVHIPYQRPVAQRGIRFYGPPLPVASGAVGVSTTPLTVAVSLPTATLSPGSSTVSAGTLQAPVSLPPATLAAGGAALGAGTLSTTVSLPPVTASAGGVSLSAGTLTATVSLPTATISAPAAAPSVPLVYGRPVFQHGIRAWGPPAPSTTPELNRTLTVDALSVTVSLPTASIMSSGDPRLPAPYLRIRTALKARPLKRPSVVAPYGAIDQLAPAPQTATATPLGVAVSLPPVTVTTTTPGSGIAPQFWRIRRVTTTVQYPRTSKANRYGFVSITTPGTAQGLSVTPLGVSVSLPPATVSAGAITRQAGTLGTSVSLPAATLIVGPATLQASPLTVAVSLTDVQVQGIIGIPPTIFDTTLESRLPDRTLHTDLDYTLEVTS